MLVKKLSNTHRLKSTEKSLAFLNEIFWSDFQTLCTKESRVAKYSLRKKILVISHDSQRSRSSERACLSHRDMV